MAFIWETRDERRSTDDLMNLFYFCNQFGEKKNA